MDLQHVNVKFFVADPGSIDLEAFQAVFNNWIQRSLTDEVLVDVADYRHVFNGPGIVLIGHHANYGMDNAGGRPGLLYNRKTPLAGTNLDRLLQAARAALTAARLLEKENGVKFSGQEAQVIVNDRLVAPNDAETFAALEPDLKAFLERLYNGAAYELSYRRDPRERFQVDVKASAPFDIEKLLQNLGVPLQDTHREQVNA